MTKNKCGCGRANCNGCRDHARTKGCGGCGKCSGCRGGGGATGATGATGPSGGGGGQFKFSGRIEGNELGGVVVNYLADAGIGPAVLALPNAPQYPLAAPQSFTTFVTNVLDSLPTGQQLKLELVRNGTPVGLPITYLGGQSGIKFVTFPAEAYAGVPVSDVIDVVGTSTSNIPIAPINVSAMVA